MSLQILNRINFGYGELEPTIVGLMAMHKSFMLIGRHGTGKTRLARMLSLGYGEDAFVFYDATKDDLISIAGVPDPEALKGGRLHFVPHERSIWAKSTIVVDEITRAGKESQNLWLEILEDRRCFGLPLAYRTLIATANPESYAAAFQLDEALLDRFHAVLPVPEHQSHLSAADVKAMIGLAARGEDNAVSPEELARTFTEIQQAHADLLAEGAMDRVADYLGQLVPALLATIKEQGDTYISARTFSRNLPETIMAVAAYQRVAGSPQPLRSGAIQALRYAIATKFQVRPVLLEQLHEAAESLLKATDLAAGEKLRLELTAATTFEERLGYLDANWEAINDNLSSDELEKILLQLLRGASAKGEQEKLVELRHVLESHGHKGDALRQVDGRLIIALNGAINRFMPKLGVVTAGRKQGAELDRVQQTISTFQKLVSEGRFISNREPGVRKLQAYLIDFKEGDVPDDLDSIYTFLSELEL